MSNLKEIKDFVDNVSKDNVNINISINISDKNFLREDKSENKEDLSQKNTEINKLKSDLSQKNTELNELESKCDIFINIEKKYNSIENNIKHKLENIFQNNNNLFSILTTGLQKDNIFSLWDTIEYSFKEEKYSTKDRRNLKELFELLFKIYKSSNDSLKLQEVEIGYEYDRDKYSNSDNSDGTISEILFFGIVENDKVIKKSFVKINEE